MRILITGATGFIGGALAAALAQRGHTVVGCAHRRATGAPTLAVDYMRDVNEADWLPRLRGVDAVINAVGILRERDQARFAEVHHRAPAALFRACRTAGVKRVIQISALGADEGASSAYHLSKKAADDALRRTDLEWTIVQPSVVFGMGGASTRLFLALASLPVIPLVGRGDQPMQSIHIDDLAALIIHLLEQNRGIRQTVHAVGPAAVTLREMLASYRRQLGLGHAHCLPIPVPLMQFAAKVGDALKSGALSTETLGMLLRGNTAEAEGVTQALGRPPRAVDEFISRNESGPLRVQASLKWLRPLLLAAISAMWITAGIASWLYAQERGLTLLAQLGLGASAAIVAFATACLLDVGLGLLSLRPTRAVWALQLAVIAFYTGALSIAAPQLWIDPFGPLVKNIPLAVVILGLMTLEGEA